MVGKEKGMLEEVYSDAKRMYRALFNNIDLKHFFTNPRLNRTQKKDTLKKLFSNKICDLTAQFIDFLVDKNREAYLFGILNSFLDYYKKQENIVSIVFITVLNIDDSLKQKIIKVLKNEVKSEIEIDWQVDETIIGGFVLKIDGLLYDASIASKLEDMKAELAGSVI
jgi:F-type H+-transporting ATPase subunit delta